jgi:hypothetical protein
MKLNATENIGKNNSPSPNAHIPNKYIPVTKSKKIIVM